MAKLQVRDLHLSYGTQQVLKGVSLDLEEGEVVVLLGSSGSGKTTLLRSIAGLEDPWKGELTISGETVYNAAKGLNRTTDDRNLGMVFQSYALWPHRTVAENVAYGLKLRKTAKAETEQRTASVLKSLGLDGLAERYPHQLSGGQQQRVAIARALVYNPPVLLMDEPLSNLDAQLREEAKTWLKSVIVKMDLSAIVVTHDQGEAMAIGDRIVLLANGRIEQQGSPIEIYNEPQTFTTARFFGSNNVLKGEVAGKEGNYTVFSCGSRTLKGVARQPLSTGDKCRTVIRVERCAIDPQDGSGMPCRLLTSMYVGTHWEHLFDGFGTSIRARCDRPLSDGDYRLSMAPEDVWLFPEPIA
jgi:iron(III) transport system ATP-binding protein